MPSTAGQILGMIGGGLGGQIMGVMNDQRQLAQQRVLMREQEDANKRLFDYTQAGQYSMWQKTGPVGMMKQYKAAGLNPALAYGTSGAGGTTGGGSAGGVSGAMAPSGGGEMQAMAAMGMQLQQMKAQTDLTVAQKENVQADTDMKKGVETREAEARIVDLTQGVENKKAQEDLTKVQTRIAGLDETVKGQTLQETIDRLVWESQMTLERLDQVARETYIQKATMNNKIDIVKQELVGAILRNVLTNAQTANVRANTANTQQDTKNKEQELKNGVSRMMMEWDKLSNENRRLQLEQIMVEYNTEIPQSVRSVLGVVEQAVDGILRKGR